VRAPLVRRDGELQPATWQEALAIAVAGLARVRDAGRPVGVLGSGRATNEESFLALALARSALRTPHLDAPLRRAWEAQVRGLSHAPSRPAAGVLARLEHSDLVVVVEDDLSATHPRVALAVLRAVRRGAKLVALGWQRTPLATLATAYVPLAASAPLATLAGLRTAGGVGELFDAAQRACFVIAPFVADPAVLEAASRVLAGLALGLAEGGRQQPLLLPLPVRANTRGALDMGVAPDRLTAGRSLDDADARASLRRLWGGDGCWDAGADAEEMAGVVAGLVVLGEDLPAVHPMPADARRQLGALEHLVVIDSFLTETAAAAAVVLPMAAFGEAEGSLTGLEDRAQAVMPFLAPPDSVRQGWEILADLLGALSAWRPGSLADVRAAIAASVPGYGLLGEAAPVDGWPVAHAMVPDGDGTAVPELPAVGPLPESTASPGRMLLRCAGAFDWGQDALVRFSPTLRRIPVSVARRYPHGLVTISASDARTLGVREGWTVRLTGPAGEAHPAVTVSPGLQDGLLLVPYAFREQFAAILAADGVVEVEVQPA
jgi:formate dehydrogenase major subunit